jgi:hypothetical protein
VKKVFLRTILTTTAALALTTTNTQAQITLIAKGTLTGSRGGANTDLSGLNYKLENGVPANLLGGLGSGITYMTDNTFLAVPDRGPNAVPYNSDIDDTASYIPRFQTIEMKLEPNSDPAASLPFTLTPQLKSTTLLRAFFPLVYGDGTAFHVPNGAPSPNGPFRFYFSGRSDNFDPHHNSADPFDARLDPESIRVSNEGVTVFISDEYGPYIHQFLRLTGERIRTYQLPDELYVNVPGPTTVVETANNIKGRVPNKGMEGLAITPDGRSLVGIMQAALLQDASAAPKLLRIFVVDVISGVTKHEYAYLLTTGSGVSEITALNDHEFIVDERDGKGLGDGSTAKVKQLFKIDLQGATDIKGLDGPAASTVAVTKVPFLDIVQKLKDAGIGFTGDNIPAKIEGVTFGPDVELNGKKLHTLWIANDNDFLQDNNGPNITSPGINPNQFFVFGFTDADLEGSQFVPQKHPFFFNF